jgi:hypothetical protein
MAEAPAAFRYETARLVLRDWRADDWPEFWRVTNTPAVMRWLGGVAGEAERDAARERLESYQSDHGHTFWVLERKDDGALLGFQPLDASRHFLQLALLLEAELARRGGRSLGRRRSRRRPRLRRSCTSSTSGSQRPCSTPRAPTYSATTRRRCSARRASRP